MKKTDKTCPKCHNYLNEIKDKEHSTFWCNEFIYKCPVCSWWKYKDNHKIHKTKNKERPHHKKHHHRKHH